VSYGKKKKFEPVAILGLVVTVLLHGGAVVGIFLYRARLEAAQKPPPPPSYVVAKLVRLGKQRDEKKMPNKRIPQKNLRKEEGIDLSADANDAPSRKKKKRKDRDAEDADRMQRSLDRAELMAAAMQEIEQEGSPDGVVGGTATKASDGDSYMTRVADLWNRTWSLPAIIPKGDAKSLYVLLVLRIDKNGRIQFPLQFDRSSGNAHFDNSVKAAWKAINKIPLPPPDRFASILANGLGLKHTWRGLQ